MRTAKFDHSGSMRTKLTEVIAATRTFVKSSNPEDPMFVVNFNEKISLGLPAAIRYIRLQQVLKLAEQSSAMIYSIGIFDEEDPDRNTKSRLARATGGEAFFPGQLSEVVEICDGIARDTRNQYTSVMFRRTRLRTILIVPSAWSPAQRIMANSRSVPAPVTSPPGRQNKINTTTPNEGSSPRDSLKQALRCSRPQQCLGVLALI
jgi:hypothetical protein